MAAKPKVIHSTTLQERLHHHLSVVCGILGCAAIEARAMWEAGNNTIVEQTIAGAAEGDKMRLKRWPRPKAVK